MAAGLIADIKALEENFRIQEGTPGIDVEELRVAQSRSIAAQISSLRMLTLPQSTGLIEAIRAGAWPPPIVTHLLTVVNHKVAAMLHGDEKTKQDPQTFMSLPNYLPLSLVAAMHSSEAIPDDIMYQIIQFLRNLGLHNPNPPSRVHICAFFVLKVFKNPLMSGTDKKELSDKLRDKLLLPKGMHRKAPYLQAYPADPNDLPNNIFKAAYAADDPPVTGMTVPGLECMQIDYPTRKTHKSVRDSYALQSNNHGFQLQAHAPSGSHTPMQQMMFGVQQMLANVVEQFAQNQHQAKSPGITVTFPKTPPSTRRGATTTFGSVSGDASCPLLDDVDQGDRERAAAASDESLQLASLAPRNRFHLPGAHRATPPAPSATIAGSHGEADGGKDVSSGDDENAMPHPKYVPPGGFDALVTDQVNAFNKRKQLQKKPAGAPVHAAVASAAKAAAASVSVPKAAAPPKAGKRKRADYKEPPRPKMPKVDAKSNPDPIVWNGGKLYTSQTKSGFRVLKSVGDKVDKLFHWGDSPKRAWEQALDHISAARCDE